MNTNKKVLFWTLYHIGLLLFSFIAAMIAKYQQVGNAFVPETILYAITVFTLSALIGYLAIYLLNRSARLSHAELNKKILPGFILFILAVFIISNLAVSLGVFVWFLIQGMELHGFLTHLFKYELGYANRSMYGWMLFFSIAFFFVLWKKSSQKEQNLREENLKFRYQTLKSQINPHFLFNSLNTLSELIYSDAKKADHYLQKLSGIYRYVLDNADMDLIPLQDEIDFVIQFFSLQKERDNDKISLSIDIKETKDYKIIPVSLQLLVENALKHNSISREMPLIINISYHDGFIVVSNNIQRRNVIENNTHKGLANLSERVRLILGKELIISEANYQFIVKLPIIRNTE